MKHIAFLAFVFLALLVSSSVHAVVNVAAWAAYAAISATQAAAIGSATFALPAGVIMTLSFLQAFNKKRKPNTPVFIPPKYGFNNADPNIILNKDCDKLYLGDLYASPKAGETNDCRFFAVVDYHDNKNCAWSGQGKEEQEYILPMPYSAVMLYLYDAAFYTMKPERVRVAPYTYKTTNLNSRCVRPYPVPQGQVTGLTNATVLHVFNDCESYKDLYTNYVDDRCKAFFPKPPM